MPSASSKLKDARAQAGLTQRQLAQLVGVPQSSVARWESGQIEPLVGTAIRLSNAVGQAVESIWVDVETENSDRA
jgi:DNA-binding XRE family transcriptional regulator